MKSGIFVGQLFCFFYLQARDLGVGSSLLPLSTTLPLHVMYQPILALLPAKSIPDWPNSPVSSICTGLTPITTGPAPVPLHWLFPLLNAVPQL